MFDNAILEDLSAFHFGHAQNKEAGTGCTVVIAPQGAVCGVDVRGGGPATRETDLLKPENMVQAVHAIVLAGGSAFGLEASCGVMDALSRREIGFELCDQHVPIVVGACLFDLPYGQAIYPDKAMGAAAAEAALSNHAFEEGNVGAGCGATVGKLLSIERAMKSGFGYQVLRQGDLIVAALVAVNAVGNVQDEKGQWIAGCRGTDGQIVDSIEALQIAAAVGRDANQNAADAEPGTAGAAGAADSVDAASATGAPSTNTTIGIIVTNAQLSKAQATKTASCAHDAYARAIKPVHTLNDGDTIFTFASGEVPVPSPDLVSIMGTEAMQQAIYRAVWSAEAAYGLPAARDLATP